MQDEFSQFMEGAMCPPVELSASLTVLVVVGGGGLPLVLCTLQLPLQIPLALVCTAGLRERKYESSGSVVRSRPSFFKTGKLLRCHYSEFHLFPFG